MVMGNMIYVQIFVSTPRPLLCQLITRGPPQMPTFSAEEDCEFLNDAIPIFINVIMFIIYTGTSGEVIFHNVSAGQHRVRVIAGDGDAVIRSHVILMPENPDFCSLNSINRGVTKTQDSYGLKYTIEWQPIGDDVGFLCIHGGNSEYEYTEQCVLLYMYIYFDCSNPCILCR